MNAEYLIADTIEGIPHPGECKALVGHETAIEEFLTQYASGRLHHAHLMIGPKGIGKASFALRMASHLFRYPDPQSAPAQLHAVEHGDPIDGKLAAGSHPNLLHMARPWDEKAKKFKTQLTVDEIRKTVSFFGTSKAESGWRVAIVDAADDMNQNAANSLLKILEEPPERTVFFVLSHSPAKVLPTIRSRCKQMFLKQLTNEQIIESLQSLGVTQGLSSEDQALLAQLSGGSVRTGIILAQEDGLDLYRQFSALANSLNTLDWLAVQGLADQISPRGKEDRYRLVLRFAEEFMEHQATHITEPSTDISVLARWAKVWEKMRNSIRTADAYNLDRKQTIINLFQEMGEAARS